MMATKKHDRIVKELNKEKEYPPFFHTSDFRRLVVAVLAFVVAIIGIVAILAAKDFIDSHGDVFACLFIMAGLVFFAYWALFSRKK